MKLKTIVKGLTVLPIVFMVGCSLSPQSVYLKPKIDNNFEEITQKTAMSVTATDKRTNKELGKRGGAYEESNGITVGNDVPLALKHALSEGVSYLGYIPTETAKKIKFNYQLNDVKYWVDATSLLTVTYLKIEGSVIIVAGSERFEGKYTTKLSKETVKRLNEDDNELFINQGFADHVKQIMKDEKTLHFLKAVQG